MQVQFIGYINMADDITNKSLRWKMKVVTHERIYNLIHFAHITTIYHIFARMLLCAKYRRRPTFHKVRLMVFTINELHYVVYLYTPMITRLDEIMIDNYGPCCMRRSLFCIKCILTWQERSLTEIYHILHPLAYFWYNYSNVNV